MSHNGTLKYHLTPDHDYHKGCSIVMKFLCSMQDWNELHTITHNRPILGMEVNGTMGFLPTELCHLPDNIKLTENRQTRHWS
jgi:hypothetical protein